MDAVRRLASLARSAREERNIRVRQPLGRMQVAVPAGVRGPAFGRAARAAAAGGQREGRSRSSPPTPSWSGSGPSPTSGPWANATASARRQWRRRRPPSRRASCAVWKTGRPATLELEGEPVTYLPEDVAVERRSPATGWCRATDRSWWRWIPIWTSRSAARGWLGRSSTGSSDPEGSRVRSIPTGSSSGSTAMPPCRGGASVTPTSSGARRWPAGWRWALCARRRSGAAGGHRRAWGGGGSATLSGRPD